MPTRAGGGGRRVTKRQKQSATAAVGNIFGGAAKSTGQRVKGQTSRAVASATRKTYTPATLGPLGRIPAVRASAALATAPGGAGTFNLLGLSPAALPAGLREHVLKGAAQSHYRNLIDQLIYEGGRNPIDSRVVAKAGLSKDTIPNSLLPAARKVKRDLGPKTLHQAIAARNHRIARGGEVKQPQDLTNAILVASGVGDLALAGLAAREAARAGEGFLAREAASKAGGEAESTLSSRLAAKAAESAPVRKVGQSAVGRGLGRVAASRGARAAGTGLRVGGKVAKQPFTKKGLFAGPVVAQAPSAVLSGDPKKLAQALSGTGTYATVMNRIGGTLSSAAPGHVAQNIVRDTFNLPAQALPSIYLPVAGIVEASQGNPGRLNKLWDSYKKSGFLPAVASGDPSKILKAFEHHPLFSALEVSGAYAGVGRGVGALGRRAGHFTEARAPLHVYGDINQERRYSANAFTQMAQKAKERRVLKKGTEQRANIDKEIQVLEASKVGALPHERAQIHDRILKLELAKHETSHPNVATEKQAHQYLQGVRFGEGAKRSAVARVDRSVDLNEQVRRINRQEVLHQRDAARPSHNENVVSEIAQGSILRPDTFHRDIDSRMAEIQHELGMNSELTPGQRASGAMLLKDLQKARKLTDPVKIAELFHSAQLFIDQHEPAVQQAIKLGIRDRKEVAQARGTVYAMRHMDATHGRTRAVETQLGHLDERIASAERTNQPEIAKNLRAEQRKIRSDHPEQWLNNKGEPLTPEQVNAHMAANGVGPRGFITHRPGFRGGRNFYQPSDSAARGASPVRTGQAFRAGAYDHSYEALREQHAHTQTVVDRNANFFNTLKEYGLRKPGGGYFKTYREAQAAAEEPGAFGIHLPSNVGPFRPVAIHEFLAMKRELEAARQHTAGAEAGGMLNPDNHEMLATTEQNLLNDAMKDQGTGRYVLVPEQVLRRLNEHQLKNTELDKVFQAYTSGFKSAILPTSPKWLIGNVLDTNVLRGGLLSGAGPFDYFLGRRARKYIQETDPELHKQLEGSVYSGAHYASKNQVEAYRVASVPVHRAWQRFTQAPGIRTLSGAYRHYANSVFRFNGWLERQPQFASFGKELRRDWQDTTSKWHHALQLQDEALTQLAEGLRGTDKQVQFAHALEDVYGRWGKNSPDARKLLTSYAPFYMWTRAAGRLVLFTLPVKHPIKTAILAAASDMSSDEEKKLGLDVFGKNRVIGFLQGGIPTKGGGMIPTQQFTSFGIFGDLPNTAANLVLPQYGAAAPLNEISFTGQQLTNADGTPLNEGQLLALAGYIQAQESIPFLSLAQKIREGGLSARPTSTVFSPQTTTQGGGSILGALGRWAIPRQYSPQTVRYLRGLSQSRQITVPAHPKGSSGGDYSQYFTPSSSSSSGTTDYSQYFKGG